MVLTFSLMKISLHLLTHQIVQLIFKKYLFWEIRIQLSTMDLIKLARPTLSKILWQSDRLSNVCSKNAFVCPQFISFLLTFFSNLMILVSDFTFYQNFFVDVYNPRWDGEVLEKGPLFKIYLIFHLLSTKVCQLHRFSPISSCC